MQIPYSRPLLPRQQLQPEKHPPALPRWRLLAAVWVLAILPLLLPGPAQANEDGAALFRANCAECHQANGQGIANVYPALAGNETVLGSGLDVALVMNIGRGEMPSFAGVLSSAEMAAIINYVRTSWGNSGAPVSAEAIEQLQ